MIKFHVKSFDIVLYIYIYMLYTKIEKPPWGHEFLFSSSSFFDIHSVFFFCQLNGIATGRSIVAREGTRWAWKLRTEKGKKKRRCECGVVVLGISCSCFFVSIYLSILSTSVIIWVRDLCYEAWLWIYWRMHCCTLWLVNPRNHRSIGSNHS